MDPVSRFLIGSLFNAALYYLLGRVLWPSMQYAVGAIPFALVWGLGFQGFPLAESSSRAGGRSRTHSRFYVMAGLLGLGLCFACWRTFSPHPTAADRSDCSAGSW